MFLISCIIVALGLVNNAYPTIRPAIIESNVFNSLKQSLTEFHEPLCAADPKPMIPLIKELKKPEIKRIFLAAVTKWDLTKAYYTFNQQDDIINLGRLAKKDTNGKALWCKINWYYLDSPITLLLPETLSDGLLIGAMQKTLVCNIRSKY